MLCMLFVVYGLIAALSQGCAAVVTGAEKNRSLATQCTIQGQSGSPRESHLIFSSLHVINLPATVLLQRGPFLII